MKKFSVLLVAVLLTFTFLFTGCWWRKKDPNVIRVNEVTHSVFYAPLYIGINKGYFADENIKIELYNGGGADKSMTALLTNTADIGLMGVEAAIYTNIEGERDAPKVFANLTKRDGSFLMGRIPMPNFKWSDLEGKEIIAGRKGGMPYMTLEYALNKNGLFDGQNVTLIDNVEFNNTVAAFEGGRGDFVTAFEPSASTVVNNNKGHIIASVGQEAGAVPFTAFMARPSFIKNNPDKIKGFIRAIIKAYNFLTTADIDEVVEAIYPSFADTATEKSLIKQSLISYIGIDAWTNTPVMSEVEFNNIVNVLVNAGQINRNDVTINNIIDNTLAKEVVLG